MRTPIHTPLAIAADCGRLAAILVTLETTPQPRITAIPLALRRLDGPTAAVILILPDGGREPLTLAEAASLADILRQAGSYPEAREHAAQLNLAAALAELEAVLQSLGRDAELLSFARRYGEAASAHRRVAA